MQVNFSFWMPTKVDSIIPYELVTLSFSHSIKKNMLKVGEWVDHFVYLGHRQMSILYVEVNDPCDKHFCLQGRAKSINLVKAIDIQEEFLPSQKIFCLAFKVVAICLFFPLLITIKACYKYLYIKRLFDEDAHPTPPVTLNELLEKYPDDPDLQCFDLCQQHENLMKEFETQEDLFYPQLKVLIQDIQDFLLKHPNHPHAQELLQDITFISIRGLKKSALELIKDEEQWFDFFHFLQKQPKFPKTLNHLFDKLETTEDKANFCLLVKVFLSEKVVLSDNLYTALLNSQTLIENLGEDEFLKLVNWLIGKDYETFSPTSKSPILAIFYSHCLPLFQRPYSLSINNLEERLLLLDDGFTQEYEERKLLANLFGIGGTSTIGTTSFKLDGFRLDTGLAGSHDQNKSFSNLTIREHIYPILQSLLNQLSQDFDQEWLDQLKQSFSEEGLTDLSSLLCCTLTDSMEEETGLLGSHAWSQVCFKEYLLIGNQGYGCGDFPGILVFKINSDQFDAEHHKKMQLKKEIAPHFNFFGGLNHDFLNQEYFKELNAHWIGYLSFPYQEMGNCPWKAIKLNFISTLFILRAYEALEQGKSFKEIKNSILPECIKLKHELIHPIPEKLLEKYLKRHLDPACTQDVDQELLKKIAQKASVKNWVNIQQMLVSVI